MNNLPISINNVSTNQPVSKPATNADAATQDRREFDNVLARQMADSKQPAKPASKAATNSAQAKPAASKPAAGSEVQSADSPVSLPGDMLSVLLAQQGSAQASDMAQLEQATAGTSHKTAAASPDTNANAAGSNMSQADTAQAANMLEIGMAAGTPVPPMSAETVLASSNAATPATVETGTGKIGKATQPATDPKALATDLKASFALGREKLAGTSIPGMEPAQGSAATPQPGKRLGESLNAAEIKTLGTGKPATRTNFSLDGAATALPAAMPTPANNNAPAAMQAISTPLSHAAWGEDFGQQITWMASQRNQSAELHLNPPQLGPLDVSLKISGDQATAVFTSPHAEVRDAIEQAIPRLREMLADSGIMLGNTMVNDQPAQRNQEQSAQKSSGKGRSAGGETADTEAVSHVETRVGSIKRHNGMVDTFA
jgi:flagellar hook-length control protein FliK